MSTDQSLQTQLKDAIARGDKQAIAALMRQGGVTGLLQSLRAVQATAVQQSMQASSQSTLQLPVAARSALQQGNLIDAIKRLREANPGLSLKAAKDHVDALVANVPTRPASRAGSTFANARDRVPTVMMGDKPGNLRWLFVLIAFLGVVWWWWSTA